MIRDPLVRALFEAGAHFGYSKTRNHPSTKYQVFGYKNRSAIIDLEQAVAALERAKEFLAKLGAEGKTILLVGNKDEARGLVEKAAQGLDLPYVASRWLGGTFTNFSQIKSRIDRLADLKQKRERGELSVYTKKEQLGFDEEIRKLERYLASLSTLSALPAAVVVVDSAHEAIVVAEARTVGIPVVSLSNTDCDLRGIAYPIVVNEGSAATIKLVLDELTHSYQEGRSRAQAPAEVPAGTPTLASELAH